MLDNVKLPTDLCDFASVVSKHEDYVILFGGEDSFGIRIKNIFILDLTFMKFYSSKIKLTSHSELCRAISMNNDQRDTVLMSAFIRDLSRKYDINIPSELFSLFHSYFETETIYLIENCSNLSIIELRDILKDKTDNWSLDWVLDVSSDDEYQYVQDVEDLHP